MNNDDVRAVAQALKEVLAERDKSLLSKVDEHDRVLRGYGSSPGLVATVDNVAKIVMSLHTDMTALRTKGYFSSRSDDQDCENENVTWKFIVEKLMIPIVTALVTAVLLYFILQKG